MNEGGVMVKPGWTHATRLRWVGSVVAALMLILWLTLVQAESRGRRRAAPPLPSLAVADVALEATRASTPPAHLKVLRLPCPTDDAAWERWRDQAIQELLTVRKPPRRNLEKGQTTPYLDVEGVMVSSTWLANKLDDCARTIHQAPASLKNLRLFINVQRNADYTDDDPQHQFGHGITDQQYLDSIEDLVKLPCLLRSQPFMSALESRGTYADALQMIIRQNQGETVNGCPAEKPKWLTLLYRSRFLGTPDDADTLGRFLVIVPAADDSGHDKWIQFGIHTPHDTAERGKPIRNVSVVAAARGGDSMPAGRFDAIVDWYRCRGDCKEPDNPLSEIELHYRLKATDITGNCQECHKLMPLSIHPSAVFDVNLNELPPESAAAALDAVNSRVQQFFKRSPRYVIRPVDDELASPGGYGPPLAANPNDFGLAGKERSASYIAACAPQLPVRSRQAVAAAMNCGNCHTHKPEKWGALNYPLASEKRSSHKVVSTGDDEHGNRLDLGPNLVQLMVLQGVMPPQRTLDRPLTRVEREALYHCLSKEYFDPAVPPVSRGISGRPAKGLLVDWLRQQDVPDTLVEATAAAPQAVAVITATAMDWTPTINAVDVDKCMMCHSTTKQQHPDGPSLLGIVGRRVASTDYDGYSSALRKKGQAGEVWDENALMDFLRSPDAFVHAQAGEPYTESTMRKSYPDEAYRRGVVTYLKTLRP